jgi:prophage tail gpP-like protein
MVRIGLSLFSYRVLHRRLRPKADHAALNSAGARRIVWAVSTSARIVPRASCLTQAVAGQYLLARAGYQSQMRVGVAMDAEGIFTAHAWLISEGRIIMGGSAREVQRYETLTDFS